MTAFALQWRSLAYHWRVNVAVALGVAAASAVLTGALLVGDSMRQSLYDLAVGRLGRVTHAVRNQRFFREDLTRDLVAVAGFSSAFDGANGLIITTGAATHAESKAAVHRISILGVNGQFQRMDDIAPDESLYELSGRSVAINEALARDLGAGPGDTILLRIGKKSDISTETVLGRRDETSTTLRATVRRILPARALGSLSLNPQHRVPRNAFVARSTLQRILDRTNQINTVVLTARAPDNGSGSHADPTAVAAAVLKNVIDPADVGLRITTDGARGFVAVESESMLIDPVQEEAVVAAARALGYQPTLILTHLANRITSGAPGVTDGRRRVIPYSTVAAIDPSSELWSRLTLMDGSPAPPLRPGEILLNEWAANDLHITGGSVELTYFVTEALGRLSTRKSSFHLRGVVRLAGAADDPGLIPEYAGVTDTENLADWDAPFPIDFSLIRERDETYWHNHRTTPKAFISLDDGQRLWAPQDRFGRVTSIRVYSGDVAVTELAGEIGDAIRRQLDPGRFGFRVDPTRKRAAAASEGTTDFGMLFVGFSFFVIASAVMLVALLFRLGIERRSGEIGALLSMGIPRTTVASLLVGEGLLISAMGAIAGLGGAWLYAALMLAGLRSWWSAAANAPFLVLHANGTSFIVGCLTSVTLSGFVTAWSVRGLSTASPRALLAGITEGRGLRRRIRPQSRRWWMLCCACAVAIALVSVTSTTDVLPRAGAFFGSGVAVLIGALSAFSIWLHGGSGEPRYWAIATLGMSNARRHPGRSLLTAGLIGSAAFLVLSVGAFRINGSGQSPGRASGTGGFDLYAEAELPVPYDLGVVAGRRGLALSGQTEDLLSDSEVIPFRLRPGDETSCLNLYRPTQPRILGADSRMMRRGGFIFSGSLATDTADTANPWLLLDKALPDGAVPAIADEAAVKWQLHLALGDDLEIRDDRGRRRRLRFVGLLKGSVLQDEIVVADSRFVEMFPNLDGQAFYLLSSPAGRSKDLAIALEKDLAPYGVDVARTADRLMAYNAVQNTYLSTFQSLGGLGLVLGVIGLSSVLLRNVWERRSELALLQAVGFGPAHIHWLIWIENGLLLVCGLSAGCLAAGLAVLPVAWTNTASLPWLSLMGTLLLVVGAGAGVGIAATGAALRSTSLIPALRSE